MTCFGPRTAILLAPALLLAAAPAATLAQTYVVDPAHTSIVFSVKHLEFSYTYGMFRKAEGRVEFDKDDPAACKFNLSVDVASLDTMNEQRDQHLRSEDFFDVDNHPKMTFVSTEVTKATGEEGQEVYQAKGALTVRGVTREVTMPMTLVGAGVGMDQKPRIGFLCRTSINRSDFGMDYMVGPGDAIGLTLSFEAAAP